MYQLDYPWLLVLLPLPLLIWWIVPPYKEQTTAVRIPFFEEVARAAGVVPTTGSLVSQRSVLQTLSASLAWILIVLALARPQFIEPPLQKTQPQRDLMLAIDLSQSMDTKDFREPNGTLVPRVEAVRKVVADFVSKRQGDRIGLIAFGDAPYPLAPFTMAHATVQTMISDSLPGMAGPRTALGDAIGLAIKMFNDPNIPEKVLVLLTDGNDTASKMPPAKAADIAKTAKITVHTIGIGDMNAVGEDKLDVAMLQKIADATGGRYFFGQDLKSLENVYATLDRITPATQKILSWQPRTELFVYPLGAALVLLVLFHALAWLGTEFRRRRELPGGAQS
ncbi:VWA domain-containing protein [Phyllobacterium sp.]|uniref:vWA domain-containing protein n=1 Tax=unclassified Phyllobacterium TaxID=2638441 RepID=UPI0031FD0BB0|nr:VWA domain-containing protein [Phyllobacterium sp.]